jgi:hypothetical protein
MGTAKSGEAPVDEDPSAIDGVETFEQDTTMAAWAQWHCKLVTVAHFILLTMFCIQLYLGLRALHGGIGIPPKVSSIFGLVCSKQYFKGDVRLLKKTLNCVQFPGLLAFSTATGYFLIPDPTIQVACCSMRFGESRLRSLPVHLPRCQKVHHHLSWGILGWSA